MLRWIGLALLALLAVAAGVLWLAGAGRFGSHEEAGTPTERARAASVVAAAVRARATAAGAIGVAAPKQILFGDLHVHTTFSTDAFLFSLPIVAGEGAHPPADACDFARFCSALDFWSINDHAEGLTPAHWSETVDSIRQCNAIGQREADPDTVAFLGWEWTQTGALAKDHYGHKNVVLAHTDDARIPTRPIGSDRGGPPGLIARAVIALRGGESRYHDLARFFAERAAVPDCPDGVSARELPPDCHETARTPADLYRKLDEWGHASIVIPHGTTWGNYTPQGSSFDKQLAGAMHDPDRQTLIEVYSGHGESEVWRDWRPIEAAADGTLRCPAARDDYLPTCWQAGEIIRARCLAEGSEEEECERRAAETRAFAADAGARPHLTVPAAGWQDWIDAGQCRDCEQPAFNYRPRGSAQYLLTLGNFDAPGTPRRFRLGFIASSDNHFARPGTGFKERDRIGMTESMNRGGPAPALVARPPEEPLARGREVPLEALTAANFTSAETERIASYLYTGGLVAAHASGRDRESIWSALERREVYATSGPRILLWFDLLNPPDAGALLPMGSEVRMTGAPRFRARAVGSFEQRPGCPEDATSALGSERLEYVCKGECYHPSDQRRHITRIDVIRIRPQVSPDEDPSMLVEDPWRRFECAPDPAGCSVEFEDPDHAGSGRDSVYYVRAVEEPAPAINGNGIHQRNGEWVRCPGAAGADDDCLGEHEPRAWSSPIFVDHGSS
jgi:hypothetical protein